MPRKGDYRVICDYSGFKCWASETRMTWDGFRVLKRFWEPRQPQDYIPPVRAPKPVPNPRPPQYPQVDDN